MTEQSGTPGRYQRSASGLVASLVVTAVVVFLLVWVMGLFRSEPEAEPTEVDHVEAIGAAQAGGHRPAYPTSLPAGWIATGFEVESGGDAAYGLKLLTDERDFVGVSQGEESVTAALRTHVDEDDAEISGIEEYAATDSVAPTWEGYVDTGGDTAYAAEVDGATVLVYGSAPAEDLQQIVDRLTTEPVAD